MTLDLPLELDSPARLPQRGREGSQAAQEGTSPPLGDENGRAESLRLLEVYDGVLLPLEHVGRVSRRLFLTLWVVLDGAQGVWNSKLSGYKMTVLQDPSLRSRCSGDLPKYRCPVSRDDAHRECVALRSEQQGPLEHPGSSVQECSNSYTARNGVQIQ